MISVSWGINFIVVSLVLWKYQYQIDWAFWTFYTCKGEGHIWFSAKSFQQLRLIQFDFQNRKKTTSQLETRTNISYMMNHDVPFHLLFIALTFATRRFKKKSTLKKDILRHYHRRPNIFVSFSFLLFSLSFETTVNILVFKWKILRNV